MATNSVDIPIDECGTVEITIHVHGLYLFKVRMLVVLFLLKCIKLASPKNVYVQLCDECASEN